MRQEIAVGIINYSYCSCDQKKEITALLKYTVRLNCSYPGSSI